MSYRSKTLSERQLREVAQLTDNTGGTASDTLAAATNTSELTDSTGGTADTTLAAISGSGADAGINNNFADLAAQLEVQRALNTVLLNAVASLAAKVNATLDGVAKTEV